eukprot:TRINITY_DN6465_c0_g1_i6.p1 TRINITY_DN6465_c0_g1~~TRINITY_DN6465_c0_g1_i6.p1  ORF type:complete len:182 (+),score=42.99 TRINITY_DN6465_c0_g1_i6:64-609(+)
MNFTFPHPTHWVVTEKTMSLTGNDFVVKDGHGQVVFRGKGKTLSLSDQITLENAHGHPVLGIKKEHMHIHPTYVISTMDGKPLVTCQAKIMTLKPQVKVFKGDSKDLMLRLEGNFTGRNFKFVDATTNANLAFSHEKHSNISGIMFGSDEYVIEVAPHVDSALMMALVMVMDTMQDNNHGK